MKKVKYDVIGNWSEIKLDIVREYASAYSQIMNAQPAIEKYCCGLFGDMESKADNETVAEAFASDCATSRGLNMFLPLFQ